MADSSLKPPKQGSKKSAAGSITERQRRISATDYTAEPESKTPKPEPKPSAKHVFDAIVITAANENQAEAYRLELELRQSLGIIAADTLVIAAPDPADVRIGSGGATLNALATACERLCGLAGFDSLNLDYIAKCRILILHSGGDSQRMPICSVRGKAFCSLPSLTSTGSHLNAPIDFLIDRLTLISAADDAPEGGCLITCTDTLTLIPDKYNKWVIPKDVDVVGFAITTPQSLGPNHGVYLSNPKDHMTKPNGCVHTKVTSIFQKASLKELDAAGAISPTKTVEIDSGIVYFSSKATVDFLRVAQKSFLWSCTGSGLDSGGFPIRFELYTDILMAHNPAMTRQDFISMPPPDPTVNPDVVVKMRQILWKIFNPLSFRVVSMPGSEWAHVGTTKEYLDLMINDSLFRNPFGLRQSARTYTEYPQHCEDSVLINVCLMGPGVVDKNALVENSRLTGNFHIHSNALCSSVRSVDGLQVLPKIVIQECHLSVERVQSDSKFWSLLTSAAPTTAFSYLNNAHQPQSFVISQSSSNSPALLAATANTRARSASSANAAAFASPTPRPLLSSMKSSITANSAAPHNLSRSAPPTLWVLILFGLNDPIKKQYTHPGATLCGRPWSEFFANCDVTPADVWDEDVVEADRTIWTARLYPIIIGENTPECITWMQYPDKPPVHRFRQWKLSSRASLQDILRLSDSVKEFNWRAALSFAVDLFAIEDILFNRLPHSLIPIISRTLQPNKQALLRCLDDVAVGAPLDVAARAFCAIADTLNSFPGVERYSRSGASRNLKWLPAFRRLATATNTDEQALAVSMLRARRELWLELHSPELIIRAARHYDGAYQCLIRRCVESVPPATFSVKPQLAPGSWVDVESPIRVDLAGAWSDTPPVTFEHGGEVVNVALRIDGGCPIGCSARSFVIPEGSDVVLIGRTGRTKDKTGQEEDPDVCKRLSDLSDYTNPAAPSALVKCVLLCMGVVSLESDLTLGQQLQRAIEGVNPSSSGVKLGLEVRTWSTLPQGTGLGVSSIMAANVIAALAAVTCREYSKPALITMVLLVEQLLSTGGGWQDQVGGVLPGFKYTLSPAKIPYTIEPAQLEVSKAFVDKFNQHIVLIHTGTSRLARNLLQTVVRRWYQRGPGIQRLVDGLCENARNAREAVLKSDIEGLGRCLDVSWVQKKEMATPSSPRESAEAPVEPEVCKRLIERIRRYVYGLELAGAGGGGFMVLITKEPRDTVLPQIQKEVDALNVERRKQTKVQAAVVPVPNGTKKNGAEEEGDDGEEKQTPKAVETTEGDVRVFLASVCDTGLQITYPNSTGVEQRKPEAQKQAEEPAVEARERKASSSAKSGPKKSGKKK